MMAGPVPLDHLPHEVFLGVELDFFFQDDVHGLLIPFALFPLLLSLQ